MGERRRQFPACDGLRAVAAGAVLLFHACALTGLSGRSGLGPYMRELDVGVDVFFVLSGFLLYRPLVRAHLDGDAGPNTKRYLSRRFLRIFPAYWVALAALVWIFGQATINTAGDGLWFFGLAQIYSGRHSLGGLVPAWSLCTEVAFYVALPVYAVVVARLGRGRDPIRTELVGVGVLYAASAVFRIMISVQGFHLAETWLPAYLDVFALGMLLAVVSVIAEERPSARWWRSLPTEAGLWWLVAGALFLMVSNLGMPLGLAAVPTGKYMLHHLLAGLVGLFLVCPAVVHDGVVTPGRRFLMSRPLVALGLVSYGIFLWHLPWIVQAAEWTGGKPYLADFWPVLAISVVLTLATAVVSYLLIERPLLGRRRARRVTPDDGAASPPAPSALRI